MTLWLQISSGQGPEECQLVVARIAAMLLREADQCDVTACTLAEVPGDKQDTLKSVLIALDGESAPGFAEQWRGTIQWIGTSPYRPNHKRKNWFVGIEVYAPPEVARWAADELRIDTMRASGPGGQHVNKTSSAVRITHVPTGMAVVAQEERSQHRNRQLALARLAQMIDCQSELEVKDRQRERWLQHAALERGNPIRVYQGPSFKLVRKQATQTACPKT